MREFFLRNALLPAPKLMHHSRKLRWRLQTQCITVTQVFFSLRPARWATARWAGDKGYCIGLARMICGTYRSRIIFYLSAVRDGQIDSSVVLPFCSISGDREASDLGAW